jgi:hypothetical protein
LMIQFFPTLTTRRGRCQRLKRPNDALKSSEESEGESHGLVPGKSRSKPQSQYSTYLRVM